MSNNVFINEGGRQSISMGGGAVGVQVNNYWPNRVTLTYFDATGVQVGVGQYTSYASTIEGVVDDVREMPSHPGRKGRWLGPILVTAMGQNRLVFPTLDN